MRDLLHLTASALAGHRLRSVLSMLGIAIGIAAVTLLTSIGEGTRRYVLEQFAQFGTNIIAVNPGKTETVGIPGVMGGTTHKLSIDDAEALKRLPGVLKAVPFAMGQARVEGGGRGRSVFVYGVTADMPEAELHHRHDLSGTLADPEIADGVFARVAASRRRAAVILGVARAAR